MATTVGSAANPGGPAVAPGLAGLTCPSPPCPPGQPAGAFSPAQSAAIAQQIVTAFGPAGNAVVAFLEQLAQVLAASLDQAAQAVNQFAGDLGGTIASAATPAIVASMQMQQGAANAMQLQLAQAAEYLTAATGVPQIVGVPAHPDQFVPTSVPSSPAPGGLPSLPATVPVPGVPSTPMPGPGIPGLPSVAPGSMPPAPGVSPVGPTPWGQGAPSAAVAAGAPAGPAGSGLMSVPPGSGAPAASSAAASAATSGGLSIPAEYMGNPCWIVIPMTDPNFRDYPQPPGSTLLMGSNSWVYYTPPPACIPPSLTPPMAPTPTPSPTPPPLQPTPVPGAPPAPPTGPGTPPELGPPTAPPTPPPTGPVPPTGPQPPVGPPTPPPIGPPTPPCPPGQTWVPDPTSLGGGGCESPIPLIPEPPIPPTEPPIGPPPIGPPPPPPVAPAKQCGLTREAPCFVAASSLDSSDPHLQAQDGAFNDVAKSKTLPLNLKNDDVQALDIAAQIVDMGDAPGLCSIPYQCSLTTNSDSFATLINNSINLSKVMDTALQDTKRSVNYVSLVVLAPLFGIIDALIKVYGKLVDLTLQLISATGQGIAEIAQSEIVFKVLNFFCLGSLSKVGKMLGYCNNIKLPVGIPSPDQAAEAWLANQIDDCTFQAYVQAGDMRFNPYKSVAMAGALYWTPEQLMALSRRGKLARGQLGDRLKEQASKHVQDIEELDTLTTQVPSAGDLIRFMARDVDNAAIVTQFDLDAGFDANWTGQTAQWSDWQGLSRDVMIREWRAHWDIPSPTQLFEFWRRLRHNPAFGGVQKVANDVIAALTQQDIPKYWQEYFLAVSTHAMTRTDANRAFERGWIDDQGYLDAMYNQGYSDEDAATLLRFATSERDVVIRHLPEVRLYADCLINELQLQDAMNRQDWSSDIIQDILSEAQYQRQITQQRLQIDAIARQYRACRLSLDDAKKDAEDLGIPADLIECHLTVAGLNSTCGTRRETAAMLCQALALGDLTAEEYVARMKVLKFDDTAINTYLLLCQNKIKQQQVQQQLRQQKQQQQAEQQQEKAQQKAAKQAAAQANRIARLAAANERRRQARNDQLMSATSKLGQHLSDVTGPPNVLVQGLYQTLQTEKGLSQDEAAKVIGTTAAAAKGMTSAEYTGWVMQDALIALNEPWTLFPGQLPAIGGLG